MPNDLPLPQALTRARVQGADHLRYLYYSDTPYRIKPTGELDALKDEQKGEWIRRVGERANGVLQRMAPLLDAIAARQQALADAAPHGFCADWATASRLLVGTGYKNTLEVGLGLHPLYGVPYLPGSSIKGLVRAWFDGQPGRDADQMRRLFGSAHKDEGSEAEHQVGALSFYDAFPRGTVRLEADVLTPHFGPYYQDPTVAPAVWHDPNPVAFLAVAAGVSFRFVVTAHVADGFAQAGELEMVRDALGQALAWLGAGAKTSNGYGRFDTAALRELFTV